MPGTMALLRAMRLASPRSGDGDPVVLDEGMDPEAVAGALEARGYAGWTARRVARSVEARYRYREGRRLSWALVLPQPMTRLSGPDL